MGRELTLLVATALAGALAIPFVFFVIACVIGALLLLRRGLRCIPLCFVAGRRSRGNPYRGYSFA